MDATLNGILLELETIRDSFPKSIVRHQMPYRDDVELEDMGMKERRIRLRCYFWDVRFNMHKELLALLWGQTEFELNHPIYGLLKGAVENIDVRADDRIDTAEIDLDFVVGKGRMLGTVYADVEGETEELFTKGIEEATDDYGNDLKKELPAEIVDMPLDPDKTILEQMPDNLDTSYRDYIKKIDTMVGELNSYAAAIMNPVNSLIADINFLTSIPGRVMETITKVAERIVKGIEALKAAPGRFLDGFRDGMAALKSILPDSHAERASLAVTALTASKELGSIFAADETVRQKSKQMEGVRRFDGKGRLTPAEKPGIPLTGRVIEESLVKAREMSKEAIAASRENIYMKKLADGLLVHAVEIKLETEKIIRIQVDSDMPLHLVCLKYGLPYQTAERIMLINTIKNPNAVSGGVDIYES